MLHKKTICTAYIVGETNWGRTKTAKVILVLPVRKCLTRIATARI